MRVWAPMAEKPGTALSVCRRPSTAAVRVTGVEARKREMARGVERMRTRRVDV